jgi:MFS family permease
MFKSKTQFLGLQGNALSWAITCCAGSAFLLFGYDQGVLGSIISGSDFLDAIGIAADDPDTLSTVVSIYDIGNMVGCLAAAIWGGRYGRKAGITLGCMVTILGAAMQASSYSVAQM